MIILTKCVCAEEIKTKKRKRNEVILLTESVSELERKGEDVGRILSEAMQIVFMFLFVCGD